MLNRDLLKKIPQNAHQVFTKRFSRMAGCDGAEGEGRNGGISKGFESGEELETFQRCELGFVREIGNPDEGVENMSDDNFLEIRRPALKEKRKRSVETVEMVINDKRWDLDNELSQMEIKLERLQGIASSGIADGGELRSIVWKLLLGYLPTLRDLWEKELLESRMKYAKLKEDFLLSPSQFSRRKDEAICNNNIPGMSLEREEVSHEDHPLCLGKSSAWHQFFEFADIGEQIDRDLDRTHPSLKFFAGDSTTSKKNKESMKNILLLFAKLNPEIRYVQGMNEILAPLYYVFSTESDNNNNNANAESDSFHCFVKLMSNLLDHYCEQLDNSSAGIHSTLLRLSELLKANDKELWRHLELKNKVGPQLYGFRWITLLLTQEFDFRTILRIWDSLLSNPLGVQEMLLRVCCAMLLSVKTRLLRGDFMDNLQLLQHYPSEIDIECILKTAQDLTAA
ncbi:OLC1v1037072C1 [Oldenlandia corymbosa var. corymbosa]|uniref:OLC1v1037072C1 n=1 Tax=Oldenlandia corymbosa var. corymbosa TaxID=529605 RepID=A0AAV1CY01_OLDCO|nr:OLC1v1037072C1 [Oldenlandia corymbosa var. corymbosa]